MKITKKKHSELKTMLEKAMTYYFVNDNHYPMPKLCDRIIQRIQEILANDPRSLPHQHYYWIKNTWLSSNMPEKWHDILGINTFTPEYIHELKKASQNVSSTAFNAMSEIEFTEYDKNCDIYICTKIFEGKITSSDMDEMIKSA